MSASTQQCGNYATATDNGQGRQAGEEAGGGQSEGQAVRERQAEGQ